MFLTLLLLQFCAHLLADFIFQSQSFVERKYATLFNRHHLFHFLIVGSLSYLCSFDIHFWIAALAIATVHLITDICKGIQRKPGINLQNNFFFDQLIHIVFFSLIVWSYSTWLGISFIIPVDIRIVAIVTGFILCSKPANILIMNLFEVYAIEISNNHENSVNDLPNAGRLIGNVERFLVLALIILKQYEAVGLLIAAKSILRFSDTKKTEYVLVGTLLSFAVALFTGIMISLVK